MNIRSFIAPALVAGTLALGAGAAGAATPQEDAAAASAFNSYLGVATATGGVSGTLIGAIIGCATGGITTAPTVVLVPAGCVTGAAAGAGIGGVIGTIVVGGPVLVVAGADLITTLLAAPGTTRWAVAQ